MHYFEEISTLSLMIAGLSSEVAITTPSDKSGCDSKELSKLFPCALPMEPEWRNIGYDVMFPNDFPNAIRKTSKHVSSWWFQPLLVKLDHVPR